jgi:hypothetical protein
MAVGNSLSSQSGSRVVDPDDLMTIEDVLTAWPGKFTANELRSGITRGEIGHVRKGRRKLLTRAFIGEYLSRHTVTPCPASDERRPSLSLGGTGSTGRGDTKQSTATGTMEHLERSAAEAVALQILKRPSSSSQS